MTDQVLGQEAACLRMVNDLMERDVLRDVHAAMVESAVGLARAVDVDPHNAALWREYRAAVRDLKELADDDGSDELQDLYARITAKAGD